MNAFWEELLVWSLRAAAAGQLLIAVINLRMVQWLGWEKDLASMPLLLREVFHVHKYFISITVALFAVWTLRFAGEMAAGEPMARWLAGGISLFWGIRTWMQWGYYSREHWRGQPGRTAAHWTLTLAYGSCAIAYGWAAAIPPGLAG
jgi:hypothetical protein